MKIFRKILTAVLVSLCLGTSAVFLGSFGIDRPPETPRTSMGTPAAPETPPAQETPAVESTPPPEENPEAAPVLMASPHFAMDEYRCDCTGYCDGWPAAMEPALLEKIEVLRCCYDLPVIITSGVRCEARNEEVGGVSWSFHKRGRAADLYCPGVGVGELAQTAKALGMNVLPYYGSGYIHVELP